MALLTNINGKFSVSDVGAVTFNNAFTFPTADGAANYVLQTNGSGQLAWALNGNGDISGSGTANTVTKFTGSGSGVKTIGNGPITFSSNDSTFAGTVETTKVRSDIMNNKADTANIIYRSGTDTIIGNNANALVVEDGGNVGIGTASPNEKLEVAGNVGVNGFITHNGDSGTFMGWSANDTNVFYTAGNERMRIDSSGDVTIQGGRIYLKESDLGNTAIALTRDADEGYVQLFSSGTQTVEIRGNGNSYFNGGNVLIGSSSAAAGVLVVDGNSANNIWVVGRDSDGTGSLSFRNAADNAYNARLEAVSGALKVETNGTLALTIDSSQNAIFAGTVTAPTFSGDLNGTINTVTTATTKGNSTNDTTVATTAFVQNVIGTIPAGLVFQGTWNASTNTPTLTSGSGTTGNFYIVSVAGSTNLDGITDWQVGDWAVFIEQGASDQWEKIDNSSVLSGSGTGGSFAGWSGSGTSVTLGNAPVTFSGNNSTFTGTVTAPTFLGDLNGTINTLTTAVTQSANNNSTKVATTAYVDTSAGLYLPLAGGTMTGNTINNDNVQVQFGTSPSLKLFHTGGISYIENLTGDFYIKSTNVLRLNSGSNESMIIANPNGAVQLYYDNAVKLATTSTGVTVTGALFVNTGDASGNRMGLKGDGATTGTALHTNWTTGNSYLDFRLGGDTDTYTKMRITNGGNVGIGTNSPGSKLTINETSTATAAVNIVTARYGISLQGAGATSNSQYLLNLQSDGGAKEVMRVQSSGNVGIGTTSPIGKLTVQGDDADIYLRSNDYTIARIINRGSSGQDLDTGLFSLMYSNTENVRIDAGGNSWFNGGNVGIGTTSPNAKLDVNGVVVISPNTDGKNTFQFDTGAAIDDARLLMKSVNTVKVDIQANGLSYFNGGNVGIGDTNPAYRLSVKKVNAATPAITVSGAFYGGPRIQTYGLDADADAWMGLGTDMAGLSYEHSIYFPNKASTGQGVLTIGSYDGTTYSEKMRIANNGWVSVVTKPNSGLNYDVAIWVGNVLGYQTTSQLSDVLAYNANKLSPYNGITFADGQEATNSGGTVIPAPGRSTSPDPEDYQRSFSTEFKLKSASGNPGVTGSWAGLISMAPYRPSISGFYATQIAFGGDGTGDGMFTRRGTTTTWGAWREFVISDSSGNTTFAGKILVGTGATAAASINSYSTTVSTGLYSALRVIEHGTASSYWDIGATNAANTLLNFYHNGNTTPKIFFTHTGGATFTGNVGIGDTGPVVKLVVADKSLTRHSNSSWGQSAVANPNDAECGFVWGAGGTGYPGITSTYTRQWIAGLSPFGTGTDRWSLTNKTLGANTAITVLEDGKIGMGTISPSGPFHVKVGTSTPLIVASSSYCNNVGIRTTTPTASLQVKGNVSYSYNNYTNVANTWINVINFSGYPAGLYQISIIKKTNASTYITAIVKWSATAGTVISTIASNQLGITFSGTQLQAISGVATGTLMSANLQCLVTNEDFCS